VEGRDESEDKYEVSLVLVRCDKAEHAPRKALALAKRGDERYTNADGEVVTWKAVEALGDAYAVIDGVEEGNEVYSFFIDHALLAEIRSRLAARSETEA
jgi:hypothetical protein